MKRHRVQNLIVAILFGIALAIPLLLTDFSGGKVSATENRQLAPFPISVDMEHGTVDVSRTGVEQWISDNIGFRETFVKIYTIVKNKILGLSTSPLVMPGTEGWYFYTADNNIEIATGRYPLTEVDLKKIAEYQQSISDYYNSLGKEYILMLTPSKVSVYSEYLPIQEDVVSYTPVDLVADYLKEHTDVVVYNSKEALLDAKGEGQLYLKTDTHWNERGSYTVYRGLFEVMKNQGILSGTPIEVSYDQGTQMGEFSAMLGNTDLIPAEAIPVAKWDQSFYQVTEGEQFTSATQLQNASNPAFRCAILKNDTVPNEMILQIYGDSQIEIARKIPCYFAEHFSQVFNYAIRNVSPVVDAIADPDVVVFSCSERYIKDLLTVPGNVPVVVDNAPSLPRSDTIQEQGYSGMWLDTCNGQPVSEQGSIHDLLFESNDFVALEGWAADFSTMQPLSDLYLQIGDVVLQCNYGLPRDSVSSYFGTDSLLNTGFTITFPVTYLQEQTADELQFIQVGTDGTYQYAPVQYSINRQNIFNSIPLTTEQQPANNLWIDDCNGVAQPEERLVHMNLNGREQIDLTGWSADLLRSTPLGALYVQVGEQIFPCKYGGERLSVAEYFQNDALKNVGFTVSIPVEAFHNSAIEQLQFIAVTQDGAYRYENIPYRIAYDAPDVSQDQETPAPDTENELSGASAKTLLMFVLAIGLFLLAAGYLINGKKGESLQRLGQNSFLFTELVKRDFTLKYKRTILGMFWSILSPLLNLLIMWLVFSKLLGSNIDHFVVYLFAGQLVFNYFSDATNLGMTSLLDNADIFTKVNVPKYLFLFSRNVSALINFILTLFIFFLFVALEGIPFSINFLTLLYPIFCLVVLNLGVGMILSALYVFFRDMRYLWGVAIQLLTWMSAIFYSIDAFDEPVRRVFLLNPIYLCIRYFRKVVLEGTVPTIQFHLLLATFSVGIFFVGCLIYKKKNHEFLYYV